MLQVLIKPSSQKCNINCSYCFYKDMAKKFKTDRGTMSNKMMALIIKKATIESKIVHLIFQGGEPLIIGKSFYKNIINEIKKYPDVKFLISIQSNGTIIDEEWIFIFKQLPDFVIGISIDGLEKTHDSNRVDYHGQGTYKTILKSIRLLRENKINFSILSVASREFIKNIDSNLNSLSCSFNSIQLLWPIPSVDGNIYITNDEFFILYESMWNLFKKELKKFNRIDPMIYISNIDFLFKKILTGKSSPFFDGNEINELVVEANGEVFPSDFYAYDNYSMGNIMTHTFAELKINEIEKSLKKESEIKIGNKTKQSRYFNIIGPGNLRFRDPKTNEFIYLEGFERFLDKYLDEIKEATGIASENS